MQRGMSLIFWNDMGFKKTLQFLTRENRLEDISVNYL